MLNAYSRYNYLCMLVTVIIMSGIFKALQEAQCLVSILRRDSSLLI